MNASLKDILNVVGPSASLVFAAWIFLSVLQTRYVAAFERYRALVQEYRGGGGTEARRGSVRLQIALYKRRCELMRLATNLGIVAAVLLILSLLAGGLEQLLPDAKWIGQVGTLTTLAGLAMVIVAAIPMAVENVSIQRSLDEEVRDLPDWRVTPACGRGDRAGRGVATRRGGRIACRRMTPRRAVRFSTPCSSCILYAHTASRSPGWRRTNGSGAALRACKSSGATCQKANCATPRRSCRPIRSGAASGRKWPRWRGCGWGCWRSERQRSNLPVFSGAGMIAAPAGP